MTWSLPCRYSPSALSRSTASSRRLTPPFPLRADLEFQSSGHVLRPHAPHLQRTSAHDRELLVPSCQRNRCIRFHRRPKSAHLRPAPRRMEHYPHCEMRALASLRRRGSASVHEQRIRKNAKSYRNHWSNGVLECCDDDSIRLLHYSITQ